MKDIIDFALDDGINTDITLEKIKKGMSRYRLNCISGTTVSGNMGFIENADGNRLVDFTLPTGANTCIGNVEDSENNKVIYFVYNDAGRHSILRFDATTRVIEKILYNEPILNFQKDYKITGADVIDGKLYYTDGYFKSYLYGSNGYLEFNPPRKINIQKAINYTKANKFNFDNLEASKYNLLTFVFNAQAGAINDEFNVGDKLYTKADNFTGVHIIKQIVNLLNGGVKLVTETISPITFIGTSTGSLMKYNGNSQYYDITFDLLDRIKKPPVFSPVLLNDVNINGISFDNGYGKDATKTINYLKDNIFQFCYRYTYNDNEKSVWSPISKVALPFAQEYTKDNIFDFNTDCNVIGLQLQTGNEDVKKIEIAVRHTNDFGTLKRSPFTLIETIDRFDENGNIVYKNGELLLPYNSEYYYLFYNNNVDEILENKDQQRLFDYVPQVSKTQSIVHSNRLIDGNVVEGYNNVDTNIVMGLAYGEEFKNNQTALVNQDVRVDTNIKTITDEGGNVTVIEEESGYYRYYIVRQINGLYQFSIVNKSGGDTKTLPAIDMSDQNNNTTDWYLTLKNRLQTQLNLYGGWKFLIIKDKNETYVNNPIYTTTLTNDPVFYIDTSQFDYFLDYFYGEDGHDIWESIWQYQIVNQNQASPTMKKGTEQCVGMVYYDRANRSSGVQRENDTKIFIPVSNLSQPVNLVLNIYHTPPDWATHYQVVYAENKVSDFIQAIAEINDTDANKEVTKFKIAEIIANTKTHNKKDNVQDWAWAKGDRLRILGFIVNGKITSATNLVDVEITYYDSATFNLETDWFSLVEQTGNVYSSMSGVVIEVYRLVKESVENELYWEIGEELEIGNPHTATRYHKGNSYLRGKPYSPNGAGNQYSDTYPAEVLLTFGDVYLRSREQWVNNSRFYYICECNSISDFYNSSLINIGRINTIIKDAKRQELKGALRFSHVFIDNSNINGLSRNDYDDTVYLPDKFNGITALKEVGYTLKVLQKNNITSIDIGRITTAEADGSSNVILSGNALGTIRPSTQPYGCWHSESVCKKDRNLYFWDGKNNAVVKDSANGMEAISDRGVSLIFATLSQDWGGIDKYNVYSVYDSDLGYIIFTFKLKDTILVDNDSFTIAYHEDTNTWKTYFSFVPENMTCINNVLITFMAGRLWTHDSTVKCNFYGQQFPMTVDVIFNQNYNYIKEYRAIEIGSNKNKYNSASANKCWEISSIDIPPSTVYPQGMKSRLKGSKFKQTEGLLYSELLRDMNTPTAGTEQQKLISGRPLRGQCLQATLNMQDASEKTILQFVTLTANMSEPTNN